MLPDRHSVIQPGNKALSHIHPGSGFRWGWHGKCWTWGHSPDIRFHWSRMPRRQSLPPFEHARRLPGRRTHSDPHPARRKSMERRARSGREIPASQFLTVERETRRERAKASAESPFRTRNCFYFGTIMIPVALLCFHFGIEEIRDLSSSQQNTPLSGWIMCIISYKNGFIKRVRNIFSIFQLLCKNSGRKACKTQYIV